LCTPSRVPRNAGCCTRDRAENNRILWNLLAIRRLRCTCCQQHSARGERRSCRPASRPGRQPTAATVPPRHSAEHEDQRRDRGQDQRAKDGREVIQVRTHRPALPLSAGPLAVPVAAKPSRPNGSHSSNFTSHRPALFARRRGLERSGAHQPWSPCPRGGPRRTPRRCRAQRRPRSRPGERRQ
jgi:hypothetical protein